MHDISLAAEKIFSVGGFPVTNTLLMTWLVMGALSAGSIFGIRRFSLVPVGLQNILEALWEALVGILTPALGGKEKAERYFPLLATLFIFILTANWFGIAPLLPAIGVQGEVHGYHTFTPLFRSSASDINFTFALALVALTAVQWFGIAALGAGAHIKKYFNFRDPIRGFVGILELFSEASKAISFSFRLFGNVFAGEVLLLIVSFLLPYAGPIPFLFLEIFVGFIQALVFTMLTALFIGVAVSPHH